MKHILVVILVILVLLLPACRGGNTSVTPSGNPPPVPSYHLSTSVSPSGSGSVIPSSGSYEAGSTVTVTAQPSSGYVFDQWGGDASGTSPTVTITMDSDKSITAHFTYSPPGTVSAPSTPSGPSTGKVGQLLTYTTGGSTSSKGYSVEYRFNWGDGGYSDWLSSPSASHSWASPGDYAVQAQARSAVNPDILSSWSVSKSVTIEKPSIPLNVRIDYIGVKDAKGGDDYGEDPSKGEIQLVIVITDGSNETHRYYIPQEDLNGLVGYEIEDCSVKQINERVYHTASAGDYLGLSIMAYDRDSNEKLLTDADIAKKMAEISGVPEAEMAATIMKALVSMLPPNEDDLVGRYNNAWYPDENYGIGQHMATCLDGSANQNFFVWYSIWSDKEPPLPERPSLPGRDEVQTLELHMGGAVAGLSTYTIRFSKDLNAGEEVEGFVAWKSKYVWGWSFDVLDPEGKVIPIQEYGTDLHWDFSFVALHAGEYTIKMTNGGDCFGNTGVMEIRPSCWRQTEY